MSLKDDLGGLAPFAGIIPQAIMHQSESGLMGALPELLDPAKKKKPIITPTGTGSTSLSKAGDKTLDTDGMKRGGRVKKMAKGGSVSSASSRADGCCTKGKTKGRFV